MAITPRFNINDVDNVFKALLAEVDSQMVESLNHVGEQAVKMAKLIPPERGFRDRTGNLRSSIGYAVFVDGQLLNMAFAAVKGGHAGVNEGQRLALEVGSKTDGYALVVVAGMNYAVHVESIGRDVLTSAEKFAENEIAKELADMVTNIKNAFK